MGNKTSRAINGSTQDNGITSSSPSIAPSKLIPATGDSPQTCEDPHVEVVILILHEDPVVIPQIAITPQMDDQDFFDKVRYLIHAFRRCKQYPRDPQIRSQDSHWRFATFDRIAPHRYVWVHDGPPLVENPPSPQRAKEGLSKSTQLCENCREPISRPPPNKAFGYYRPPIPSDELKYHFDHCLRVGGKEHRYGPRESWVTMDCRKCGPSNGRRDFLDRMPKRRGFLSEDAQDREEFYALVV